MTRRSMLTALAALVVGPKVDPFIRSNVWVVPKGMVTPRMLRVPMTIDFYGIEGVERKIVNYGMGKIVVREVKG